MSEPKKAGAASGQKVPKSKFRQKSEQERVAESKLRMPTCRQAIGSLISTPTGDYLKRRK